MEEDKFKKIIQWNIGIYFCYSFFNVVTIAHFIEDLAENPEVKILKKHEVAKAYLFSMFLIL